MLIIFLKIPCAGTNFRDTWIFPSQWIKLRKKWSNLQYIVANNKTRYIFALFLEISRELTFAGDIFWKILSNKLSRNGSKTVKPRNFVPAHSVVFFKGKTWADEKSFLAELADLSKNRQKNWKKFLFANFFFFWPAKINSTNTLNLVD